MREAFGYLRVSGKGQLDGDGFARQRDAIERFAAEHGITIARFFEEQAVSGTTDLENRPALQDLITALHENGTRVVLIEKLDRLARDLMVQETIIADLRKSAFEIISVMEPDMCSDDPSRKLVRQIFGAIAEYDRAMTVAKLRAARQRIRTRIGRCEGRKPFGAREGENAAIARILELHAQGENYTGITKIMNQEGHATRTGRQWYAASVSRVLKRIGEGAGQLYPNPIF